MKNTKLTVSDWLIFGTIFLMAAGIRSIPEIKVGYWPIGYDTLNAYLPALMKFDGNFGRWIFGADLYYILAYPFIHLVHFDGALVVKISGCVLFGALTAGLYLFVRKYLDCGKVQSLLVGLVFMVQLAALRLSWDLFRNMLALIFLLPATYCLYANHKIKNHILLLIFSFLIVLSNPLVAGLWFVMVTAWLVYKLWLREWHNVLSITLGVLPAVAMFFLMLNAPTGNSFGGHLFTQTDPDRVMGYFTNYSKDNTFETLKTTITTVFWTYFRFLIWPALYGFWILRKHVLLSVLTLWLLLGTFSSLLFQGFGLFVWDRWLFMLVVPFSIYAVAGLWDLGTRLSGLKIWGKAKWKSWLLWVLGGLVMASYIGLFVWQNLPFVTVPSKEAKAPFLNNQINAYLPPSMLNNSVGFENINDILNCINYLNEKGVDKSVIVLDHRYLGIFLLNFDYANDYVFSYQWSKRISQKTLNQLKVQNIGPVYTVWDHTTITGFERVYRSGNMVVYRDIKTYQQYGD
jgi:hypothetical protein